MHGAFPFRDTHEQGTCITTQFLCKGIVLVKVRSDQTFCFGYWETESDVGPTSAATDGAVAHLGQQLRT